MSYLFAGFLAVWTILFGYLVFLTRIQSKLAADLQSLQEQLRGRDGNSS